MMVQVYVRLKTVRSRRYVYLVSGSRDNNGRVRQKILCYLGPFAMLSMGVSVSRRKRVEQGLGSMRVDWDKVNLKLRQIPVTLEELEEQRWSQYTNWVKKSKGNIHRSRRRSRPREQGEIEALARIARARFRDMFEQIGEREYRMR